MGGKELDNIVNRHIQLGFQPFGTPYVVGSGSTQTIYQAMVKFEGTIEQHGQPKNEGEPKEFHVTAVLPPPIATLGLHKEETTRTSHSLFKR